MSYLMKAVTKITLDLSMPDVQKSITCTRGDRNRLVEIVVTNEGKPFQLPPRWSAMLTGTKPDGTELANGCVVENGHIVYDFESGDQIATCAGRFAVTVWIYDEEGVPVASPKIWVNVIDSGVQTIMNNNSSEDQFGVLQEIVGTLNALIEKDAQVDSDIRNLIRREEIVIPSSTWKDETPLEYSNSVMVPLSGVKTILLYPDNDESKAEATRVRLSAEVKTGSLYGYDATYTVFRSSGTEAPKIDIRLVAISMTPKEENVTGSSRVIMVGFDTTAEDIDASIKKNAEEIGRLKEKDTQVDEELETLRSKLKNVVSSQVITIHPSHWTDSTPLVAPFLIGLPEGTNTEKGYTVLLIPKNKETRDESQSIELTLRNYWTTDEAMGIMIFMTRQDTDPPTIPLSYLALVIYDEEAVDYSTATVEFVGVVNLPDKLMEREVKRALEVLGVTEDLVTTMGDVDAVRKDVEQAKEEIDQAKTDIEKMVSVETVTVSKTKWTGAKTAQVLWKGATDPDTVFFFFPADEPTKTAATKARMTILTYVPSMPSYGLIGANLKVEDESFVKETDLTFTVLHVREEGATERRAVLVGVDSYGDIIPTSIDLSSLEDGEVIETFADGTTKTTTIEYDADGNPVKITDGDGNETVLTW